MHRRLMRQRLVGGVIALIVLSLLAVPATAFHAWDGFHWARTVNPFTLAVGDNVSSAWDVYLNEVISNNGTLNDWSDSSVLDLQYVAGGVKSVKSCKPTPGRIEVCTAAYGNKGWLGLAQIWTQGVHITQATAKLNDTYYTTPTYNTPAERLSVMCEEIGHTFGLDHQDENFYNYNLGSCMDYSIAPQGGIVDGVDYGPSNLYPNAHDYEELESIYAHLDSTSTVGGSAPGKGKDKGAGEETSNDPSGWGTVVKRDAQGRPSVYAKDLGHGKKVFTFVTYAETAQAPAVAPGTGKNGKTKGKHDRHHR